MSEPNAVTPAIESVPTPRVTEEVAERGDDRRSARRFLFLERRTGFDRRARYPITGPLKASPVMLLAVLVTTNALSALDFALTNRQLQMGTITEGNPVLAFLFEQGTGQAWLFKTVMVLAVSVVIWHQRRYRAILSVAVAALVVYVLVVAYHIAGMTLLR